MTHPVSMMHGEPPCSSSSIVCRNEWEMIAYKSGIYHASLCRMTVKRSMADVAAAAEAAAAAAAVDWEAELKMDSSASM